MKKQRPRFAPLLPVRLTHITTADGIDLAGVVVEPRGKKKVALIWLHGLTSSFDSGQTLMRELSRACVRQGVGYFKFNTRGHHIAVSGGSRLIGAGFENFNDCTKDIRAVIALAHRRGYQRVILAGHSTGANKVLWYLYRTKDRRVAGLLLAGPGSDIASEWHRTTPVTLRRRVALAERLLRQDPKAMMPPRLGIYSAKRYMSLFKPGKAEDVFPYYDTSRRWSALQSIRQPILVVFGQHDACLLRSAITTIELFHQHALQTTKFTGRVVAKSNHGFYGHEAELTRAVMAWSRTIIY